MADFSVSNFALVFSISLIIHLNHLSLMEAVVASVSTTETQQIRNICSKTLEPYECFKCISADPSRDSNEIPELIHSLLFCMYSEANYAHINADLLSQKSTIPSLKKTLSRCSSLLFDAANLAVAAMLSIESHKMVQASDRSKAARRSVFGCAKQFLGDGSLTIPSSVLLHMINAKRLYDSAHVLFQLIIR